MCQSSVTGDDVCDDGSVGEEKDERLKGGRGGSEGD